MIGVIVRGSLLAALWCGEAVGQEPGVSHPPVDSARLPVLDTVVVTPERSASPARTGTVAVNTISGERLRRLPVRSVVAALAMVPGVAVIDVNSVGGNPRVVVRGFYGGGETDYLPALIDGVPIAALSSGAVDWDMLPRTGVSRLEVVRGASSYMQGDAAIAGAVNQLTGSGGSSPSWRAAGGSDQIRDATLFADRRSERQSLSLTADGGEANGYRHHEDRKTLTLNATYTRSLTDGALTLFGSTHGRRFEDPGPLPSTTTDRRASNPFFRFDRAAERVERAGMKLVRDIAAARVSGHLVGEYASARTVKTLPLSPDFADTKLRTTAAPRVLASTQIEAGGEAPSWHGRVIAGIDASVGRFTSRYADVAGGSLDEYSAADGVAGAAGAPARVTRKSEGAFVYWQLRPAYPLRFSLSTRADHLRDIFTPSQSSNGPKVEASHNAVTPRIAVNLALPVPVTTSNAYVSLGRVFKAPTLDQLFDERAIPIPFPPFSTTVSNASLDPQRGTAVEAGLYTTWVTGEARIDISAAAYRERMRDELDFDVNSFRYVNIGRSLHRGLELGGSLSVPGGSLVFANLTRQRVVAESGQFDGRQLKAIPRSLASTGADLRLWRGLSAGVLVSSVGGAFVDDANAVPLSGYTRLDVRIGVPAGRMRLTLDMMNALGRVYDATAFPDPAGSATTYRYPAAGRIYVLGLESR